MKHCSKCNRDLSLSEFSDNRSKKDGKATHCKKCKKLYQDTWYQTHTENHKASIRQNKRRYREENRIRVLEYLQSHPCVDCGETDPVVLEFDHLRDKRMAVSQMMERSWATVETEIAKCEVRCANCHRRKTASQFGWYRTWDLSFNGEASGS